MEVGKWRVTEPTPFDTAGSLRSGRLFCGIWEAGFQTPFVTGRKGPIQAVFRRTRWIVAVETLWPLAICLML